MVTGALRLPHTGSLLETGIGESASVHRAAAAAARVGSDAAGRLQRWLS